jgi:hypothetical protein
MRRSGRGYALILVVMIVALLALAAVTLLDLIRVDLSMTGRYERSLEARAIADGALFEVFDDVETKYPDSPSARAYGPARAAKSAFVRPASSDGPALDYSAEACWLSLAPLPGSSLLDAAGLWYQVRTISDVGGGEASAEERLEAVRPVVVRNGTFLPHAHCR